VLVETQFRQPELPGYMNPLAFGLSKGLDPNTVNKKDYLVGKGFYRCAHVGCHEVLSRQCWRPHIELDHQNGIKLLKVDKDEVFPCTDCGEILPTRKLREMHRRRVHNLRDKF
jgi:hypothetical protein